MMPALHEEHPGDGPDKPSSIAGAMLGSPGSQRSWYRNRPGYNTPGTRITGVLGRLLLSVPSVWIIALIAVAFVVAGLAERNPAQPVKLAPVKEGTELVLVFIASSNCAGIGDPDLPPALDRLRKGLRSQATERGQTFITVGVALDRGSGRGIELLARFGPFDEILSGRSWLNTGAFKYIWSEHPGNPAIPQIVVLQRKVTYGRMATIEEEHVRYRKAGAIPIVEWSRLAFPSETASSTPAAAIRGLAQ